MPGLARFRRLSPLVLILLVQLQSPPWLVALPENAGKPDSSKLRELVRQALDNRKAREPLQTNYTYLAHSRQVEFDRQGRPKGSNTDLYDIVFLSGSQYLRHIRHNDQPLPPEQQMQDQAAREAFAREHASRDGNPTGPAFSFQTDLSFPYAQLADEFDLRWKGRAPLDGRTVCLVDALPKEKQGPLTHDQDYARNFKVRLWIDEAEKQIVKVEAEVVKDGLVLYPPTLTISNPGASQPPQAAGPGKTRLAVERGTIMSMQWTKVNDEAWLPIQAATKAREKVLLDPSLYDKPLNLKIEDEWTYSDYKKFRVDTRIEPELKSHM